MNTIIAYQPNKSYFLYQKDALWPTCMSDLSKYVNYAIPLSTRNIVAEWIIRLKN